LPVVELIFAVVAGEVLVGLSTDKLSRVVPSLLVCDSGATTSPVVPFAALRTILSVVRAAPPAVSVAVPMIIIAVPFAL
jgi:hypothetical protein